MLWTSPEIANTPPALIGSVVLLGEHARNPNLELIFHDVGSRPVVSHNLDRAYPQRQLV